MKPLWQALKPLGIKSKLTAYGFTMDEITEIILEESQASRVASEAEEEWRRTKMSSHMREQLFLDAQALTPEEAFEQKRLCLLSEIERVMKEMIEHGETKELLRLKNALVARYDAHTYKKETGTKLSEANIDRARETEILRFYEVNGRGFASCPFHQERTPSMHVTRNMFYCFSCHEHGDSITFVMKVNRMTFPGAVQWLLQHSF
jgi:DNA primase